MNVARLTLRQARFTNRTFWRNPAAAGFTFVFPLMFLIILTTLFGNDMVTVLPGVTVKQSTFYVASMAAFGVITACYTNIAMGVTFQRDAGILKRVRGTPLPGWSYLLGRALHAVVVGAVLVAISAAFGSLLYDASVTLRTLPALIVTVVVGAASFAALGLAVTAMIPNADAAPAIVNATILPLVFLGNVFIPIDNAPGWVNFIGAAFPVRHFSDAMQSAFFSPTGSGVSWEDLAVVAAWGLFGLILASHYFSWEPRK